MIECEEVIIPRVTRLPLAVWLVTQVAAALTTFLPGTYWTDQVIGWGIPALMLSGAISIAIEYLDDKKPRR